MPSLGPMELLIILVIVLLLFGGSRLAGIGKSSGRAIREFKEETQQLKKEEQTKQVSGGNTTAQGETKAADAEPEDLR